MVRDLEQYSAWRQGVVAALQDYRAWVAAAGLLDGATEQRLAATLARLADDKLSVAFVAEFSRGKSELINAIFFAGYGQRILPSAAGRTTMCPTELSYDPAQPPSIRLLPIETRAANLSTSDYRDDLRAWTVLPLNVDAADEMHEVFRQVSQTRLVTVEEAQRYGLYDPEDPDLPVTLSDDGMVEISRWRHAIINFPHPLLQQGLVILDTPGLNAIGTEPELTLNLIPHAHAVLFILAADTGVTKSDIEVWREHIGAGAGRLVVLNKIDGMWDALRSDAAVDGEIGRQQEHVAHLLGVPARQVFPVSAHKALVAKITDDADLLERSRIHALEAALFQELIPAKQEIVRRRLADDLASLNAAQQALLAARMRGINEQLHELRSLRGKNQNVIALMMRRVDAEKKEFDASLFRLQATRAVFTRLSTELYGTLGMDVLRDHVLHVRDAMGRSRFSTGMRDAVRVFFDSVQAELEASERKVAEIRDMMEVMYRKFAGEHGLAITPPLPFSLAKYRSEVSEVEAIYQKQFGTATLLMTSRVVLIERFFDTIASQVKRCLKAANADAEGWLKHIMTPLEAQIRQHKDQLKHRQASIQRIHDATDSLEQKIEAFEAGQAALEQQKARLAELAAAIGHAVDAQRIAAAA
ncbi:dynamin family protein [Pseudoduganella chitinolytica]|uniref:Dynamin family protein n=1 Tax=Pseudoduganella chitinolytica TaxID=34070 RepID=A0ABY8BAS9_9BURK|nr:dynamin family protein [Pseudoduganella chitinolytica]WEF32543.1 dynamin family protein [Pseudoduganella chitinolytica]